MKVTEVRGHHTTEMQSKRSRIREGITFCLGLVMACGIGIYIGHTAGEEAKQLEEQRIHYVQEGETLWDIAGGVASNHDDIRRIIWKIQRDNDIGGNEDIQPGQRLIIKF